MSSLATDERTSQPTDKCADEARTTGGASTGEAGPSAAPRAEVTSTAAGADPAVLVAAFYKFAPLPTPEAMKAPLLKECERLKVVGLLIVAAEGVNGTVAGPPEGVRALLRHLPAQYPALGGLTWKESRAAAAPFYSIRVRVKKEIVTMGVDPALCDPSDQVGTYVAPKEWNSIVQDPEVVVVDTRNDYEVELGTFEGAMNPAIGSMNQFAAWVHANLSPATHPKVAMFCTGGIRCEKASSYLKKAGFADVFHLEGGILKYLEEVPPEDSCWRGDCYVFDSRGAVDHALQPRNLPCCYGCRRPMKAGEQAGEAAQAGLHCARCREEVDDKKRKRREERERQIDLAKRRGQQHFGKKPMSEIVSAQTRPP